MKFLLTFLLSVNSYAANTRVYQSGSWGACVVDSGTSDPLFSNILAERVEIKYNQLSSVVWDQIATPGSLVSPTKVEETVAPAETIEVSQIIQPPSITPTIPENLELPVHKLPESWLFSGSSSHQNINTLNYSFQNEQSQTISGMTQVKDYKFSFSILDSLISNISNFSQSFLKFTSNGIFTQPKVFPSHKIIIAQMTNFRNNDSDIPDLSYISLNKQLIADNNGKVLYFSGLNTSGLSKLFKYEQDLNKITQISDISHTVRNAQGQIESNQKSDEPTDLIFYNGELYFSAYGGGQNRRQKLYKYNSQSNMVSQVLNLQATDANHDNISNQFVFKGDLYFTAPIAVQLTNYRYDYKLYRYNSILNKTFMISNISPSGSDQPEQLFEYQGELYFNALNSLSRRKIFKYNKEEHEITQAFKVNLDTDNYQYANSGEPESRVVLNDELYFYDFIGSGPNLGRRLLKYNKSSNQLTFPVKVNNDYVYRMFLFKGEIYFTANPDSITALTLVKYNPTSGKVFQIAKLRENWLSDDPKNFVEFKNDLYFSAKNSNGWTKLFRYNPDKNTLSQVSDINPGADDIIGATIALENELVFISNKGPTANKKMFKLYIENQ